MGEGNGDGAMSNDSKKAWSSLLLFLHVRWRRLPKCCSSTPTKWAINWMQNSRNRSDGLVFGLKYVSLLFCSKTQSLTERLLISAQINQFFAQFHQFSSSIDNTTCYYSVADRCFLWFTLSLLRKSSLIQQCFISSSPIRTRVIWNI